MMKDAKQVVVGILFFGIIILLFNLSTNRPPLFDSERFSEENSDANNAVGDSVVFGKNKMTVDRKLRLWGRPGPLLQPCWEKHSMVLKDRPWGYIGVVLSHGPHFHRFQMADAVVIAKCLGATLVLPTITDNGNEPNGQFDNIYHVSHFIKSLQGVLRVVGRLPDELNSVSPVVVSVPYKTTPSYIEEHIKPIFKRNGVVILESFYFSKDEVDVKLPSEFAMLRCLVMYKALNFHPSITRLGDHIVSRMREAGENAGGHFICLDLLVDGILPNNCNSSNEAPELPTNRKCVDTSGVGRFLLDFGFEADTALYLTQSRLNSNMDPLTDLFRNVHTKEYSMPFNEEKQILYSGNSQYEKALDYYICSRSEVFVPTVSDIFYSNVAGERILLQNIHILVPSLQCRLTAKSSNISACLSRYVVEKDHMVYKCMC